jgi:hypothetical protein
MRVRWFAAVASVFLLASSAQAQAGRPFENSWFWGIKGGAVRFATNDESRSVPSIGGDWVITRRSGGLYVSFDMANFKSHASVGDANAGGGFRTVQLNDLRRIGAAGMFFPVKYGVLRPYAGIGMSLDLVGDAVVVPDTSATASSTDAPDQTFLSTVEDRRSQIGLLFLGGAQMELSRFAAFAQASIVPNASRFLIGTDPLVALQFGLRINVGTSIDRPH